MGLILTVILLGLVGCHAHGKPACVVKYEWFGALGAGSITDGEFNSLVNGCHDLAELKR